MGERPSERLARHRDAVLELCREWGASDIQVFGSVARRTDTEASDIDLLFRAGPDTSYFDLLLLKAQLEDLLGCRVDLLTVPLLDPVRDASILRDARPLSGLGA